MPSRDRAASRIRPPPLSIQRMDSYRQTLGHYLGAPDQQVLPSIGAGDSGLRKAQYEQFSAAVPDKAALLSQAANGEFHQELSLATFGQSLQQPHQSHPLPATALMLARAPRKHPAAAD